MSLWTLLIRELAHRRLNALILLVGIAGASGFLVSVLVSLEVHASRSEVAIRHNLNVTKSETEAMRDEIRGAMHRLGYNAIVLPKDQNLGDWYDEDYASKTMPEACSAHQNAVIDEGRVQRVPIREIAEEDVSRP